MKAETTKRLFRAIASRSSKDILKLCEKVISEEERLGHHKLASDLSSIIKESGLNHNSRMMDVSPSLASNVTELPRSKRNNELLANRIANEALRHHMVLSSDVNSRLSSIEKEYAARQRLARYGLNYKKKILLYGPPGCGKTMGAERLAFNTGLPLVKVRFDAIISSYLGDSASNLRSIFEDAAIRPSVLLLDECDFIAKSRNIKNDVGEIPRIVNMLLTLLDEYKAPGLLVATTNLEQNLDSALFRRFDDVIEMPPPGRDEIVELMKTTLSALKVAPRIPWEKIASDLAGQSAATFVKLSEEAAKISILDNSSVVRKEHVLESVSRIYRGSH